MIQEAQRLWLAFVADPLLPLAATLLAYQAGMWVNRRVGGSPFANPVLIAVLLLVGMLLLTGMPYADYLDGASLVYFMLGPATVALAVPLYNHLHAMRDAVLATTAALLLGSLTAIGSAVGIAWALGADAATLLSLAPKSVTTPIAIPLSTQIGGLASLTAVCVILTGMIGATFGGWLLDRCAISDRRARGLAIGVAAHGIGTARAFQESEVTGAFAGLAMGLNGLLTALYLPGLIAFLGQR